MGRFVSRAAEYSAKFKSKALRRKAKTPYASRQVDYRLCAVVSFSKLCLSRVYHALPSRHARINRTCIGRAWTEISVPPFLLLSLGGRHYHVSWEARVYRLRERVYSASSFVITDRCGHDCSFYLRRSTIALIHILTIAPP